MTLGIPDYGVAANAHCFELLTLVQGLRVVNEIRFGQGFLYVLLETEETLLIDLAVSNRVSRRPLLHELGKEPRFVTVFPFVSHLTEYLVAHGALLPERHYFIFLDCLFRGAYLEEHFFPAIDYLQVFKGMAADFRVCRGCLWGRPPFADYKLIFADVYVLFLHQFLEGKGAQHRCGHLAFILLVHLGNELRPFHGNGGHRFDGLGPKP